MSRSEKPSPSNENGIRQEMNIGDLDSKCSKVEALMNPLVGQPGGPVPRIKFRYFLLTLLDSKLGGRPTTLPEFGQVSLKS